MKGIPIQLRKIAHHSVEQVQIIAYSVSLRKVFIKMLWIMFRNTLVTLSTGNHLINSNNNNKFLLSRDNICSNFLLYLSNQLSYFPNNYFFSYCFTGTLFSLKISRKDTRIILRKMNKNMNFINKFSNFFFLFFFKKKKCEF